MENTIQFVSICTVTVKPYSLTVTQQFFFAAARPFIPIRDAHGAGAEPKYGSIFWIRSRIRIWVFELKPDSEPIRTLV